ncbi:MAG: hypothetical protein KDB00_18270 [Planctomycetales bacterium]|nr:hypothetical protein [Planctomycetales bacterium]
MVSHNLIQQIASAKRILVLGSSGSGKTTLSIQLARILGLNMIHLDAHFWNPGWVPTSQPDWRAKVATLIEVENWVMDGTYESTLDLRIPAADALVILDRSRWGCLWRIVKRKCTIDDDHRPDAPAGQAIDRAFLSYVWRYPQKTRPFVSQCIRQYGPEKPRIELKCSRDIQEFLHQLTPSAGAV